jgi:hypothetical protein
VDIVFLQQSTVYLQISRSDMMQLQYGASEGRYATCKEAQNG